MILEHQNYLNSYYVLIYSYLFFINCKKLKYLIIETSLEI